MQLSKSFSLVGLLLCLAACDNGHSALQGYVEGDFLLVGAQDGGRVTSLAVKEGAEVSKGDPLFTLDDTAAKAEVEAAKSALLAAQARLADAMKGARVPEIQALQAQRDAAEASLALAKVQYSRAKKLVDQGNSPPQALDEAKATLDRAQAQLLQVGKQIEVAGLGARSDQIDAAREDVKGAHARLEEAQWRLGERSVKAPADGRISEVVIRPGEVVAAGAPVVTLLPPGNVKVRFYMPQSDMATLKQGDSVSITCDGCPSPVDARISFVASEVEFTPPVIFSDQSRHKLMIMAEARPDKPVDFLRPGQPVDVTPAKP